MAKAIAARTLGDDYQARFFWLQVCRLFDDRPKVTEVEIEAENIKALDDVAVHYKGMLDYGDDVFSDYYQVKFHVTAHGAFTWQAMLDPAFINAASVPLLQRIKNAQAIYAPDGKGCRLYVYSPWIIHPDNALSKFISCTDGRIRWDVLAEGGNKSEMGKIRTAWRNHLGLSDDSELCKTLAPLRLVQGPALEQLGDLLNDKLRLAGLMPVAEGSMIHPYEGLTKRLVQSGQTKLDQKKAEALCKSENLWIGKTILDPEAIRIGIRSFLRFAEYLEDETDTMLCLLKYFEGRRIQQSADWDKLVLPQVIKFLTGSTKPGKRYLLHMPAHGSIAFLAGRCLDSKSGVDVALVQTGNQGRQVWLPSASLPTTSTVPDWNIAVIPIAGAGNDIALAISVTHDIESDVVTYVKKSLPTVSRIIHCRMPATGNTSIQDAAHACFLAQRISTLLRNDRTYEERTSRLHLFFAAPNSFVFFLGQLSRSFGALTLYEYDFDTNLPGAYSPSFSLPPK